jgi:hypothetical protein
MGEFLLSILGFSSDESHLIYVKKVFRSKFKSGDAVKIAYPNPNRDVQTSYYRIYNDFYPIELLHELVRTQNPNIVDRDGFIQYQRELRDADIAIAVSEGSSFEELAQHYGWHHEAIKASLVRHKARQIAKRDAIPTLDDTDQHRPLQPEVLTAEQISKREALLAQWD